MPGEHTCSNSSTLSLNLNGTGSTDPNSGAGDSIASYLWSWLANTAIGATPLVGIGSSGLLHTTSVVPLSLLVGDEVEAFLAPYGLAGLVNGTDGDSSSFGYTNVAPSIDGLTATPQAGLGLKFDVLFSDMDIMKITQLL